MTTCRCGGHVCTFPKEPTQSEVARVARAIQSVFDLALDEQCKTAAKAAIAAMTPQPDPRAKMIIECKDEEIKARDEQIKKLGSIVMHMADKLEAYGEKFDESEFNRVITPQPDPRDALLKQAKEALVSSRDDIDVLWKQGNWDNGVYDPTGSICEGIVAADRFVEKSLSDLDEALNALTKAGI